MATMDIPNGCCHPPADHAAHIRHTERGKANDPWRAVAEALAERMANHAYACSAGYDSTGEPDERSGPIHSRPDEWADECPFCADTAAYERYLKQAQR